MIKSVQKALSILTFVAQQDERPVSLGRIAQGVDLNVATCALGTPGHSWQLTAQSNSPLAEKGTMTAAKVLALAAAELLDQPETLAAARRELNVKTGGAYHCPIPPEVGPTL